MSAPASPVSLYTGKVMHARMKPVAHRFTYRVFSLLLDLDRLKEAGRLSRLFSIERFNLLSFAPKDHGDRDGSNPRVVVERLLARAGVARPARILLLCYPRILGFVFNPLAVYYCYDDSSAVSALVEEVRNTFGGMHPYVLPVSSAQDPDAIRQEQDKEFYVSPFLDMQMRYRFRMRAPGDCVKIRILESDAAGPILAATFAGTRSDVTDASLLRACVAMPFLTLKVVAAIHWQALKLWLKGVHYVPGPPATAVRPKPHGASR